MAGVKVSMRPAGRHARARVAAILAITGLVVWGTATAAADVYAVRGPDGSVRFTDAPTAPGSDLIIRESPPRVPWRQTAEREAERFGLDPLLVRAVIRVESDENPRAVSSKGAEGLMQLMPGTARELGVQNAFRPSENIRGGVSYLASLLERFEGRLDLALAGYNAGPEAVERYGGIPPYPETQAYVQKVLDIYRRAGGFDEGGVDTAEPLVHNFRPDIGRE